MSKVLDYCFYDHATGEQFFVETNCGQNYAEFIAKENFEDAHLIGIYEPDEADILGYDTY